jgi:hypothetical protein
MNPSGLCMCGCGEKTPLAPRTDRAKRWVKGDHLRYARGHHLQFCSRRGGRKPVPLLRRLWSNVVVPKKSGDCLIWNGCVAHGYGLIGDSSGGHRSVRVHRVVYEHLVGPIPSGHELHHLCENKRCVFPDHLVPLVPREHRRIHGRESGA